MREIREVIFRGKRTDSGEWVYGYYTKARYFLNKKEMHIIFEPDVEAFPHCEFTGYEEVLSETVGQYTGLTDKNGKKIFEGDIIRAITLDTGSEEIAVVCFGNFIDENNGDEYIGFYIEFDGIKTTITQLAMEECKNRIEIIGNIFDNPELLDGE